MVWVSFVVAAAVLALGYRLYAQCVILRAVTARLAQSGVTLSTGAVESRVFSTTIRGGRLGFQRAPGIAAEVDELRLEARLFDAPAVTAHEVTFRITGEPDQLLRQLASMPSWLDVNVAPLQANLEYRHPIFGRLLLEDLTIDRRGTALYFVATRARLGAHEWSSVRGTLAPRNEMIELGIGDSPIQSAAVILGYYPSVRGASQWTVELKHQPVRPLARALGWELGSTFEPAFVVGGLSFIVPDDRTLGVRGSVQLALDGFPKPAWPQADHLLGNTLGFTSRIEPAADLSRWDMPQVDVSMAPYSMAGVARLEWGSPSRFALDVSGSLNCDQLGANLPPSNYLAAVKRYLSKPQRERACGNAMPAAAPLRLQIVATSTADPPNHIAWHLAPGCGLAELATEGFLSVELPAHSVKRR